MSTDEEDEEDEDLTSGNDGYLSSSSGIDYNDNEPFAGLLNIELFHYDSDEELVMDEEFGLPNGDDNPNEDMGVERLKEIPILMDWLVEGNVDFIEYALSMDKEDRQFKVISETDTTMMHVACAHGHVNLLELFLRHGNSLLTLDENNEWPLSHAVIRRQLHVISWYLDTQHKGGDFDCRAMLHKAFTVAALHGVDEFYELLLTRGIDVPGHTKSIAISNAVHKRHISTVNILVGRYLPESVSRKRILSEVASSMDEDNPKFLECLRDNGIITLRKPGKDIRGRIPWFSDTPLHSLATRNYVKCVRFLHTCGYNLFSINGRFQCVLNCTIRADAKDVLIFLLSLPEFHYKRVVPYIAAQIQCVYTYESSEAAIILRALFGEAFVGECNAIKFARKFCKNPEIVLSIRRSVFFPSNYATTLIHWIRCARMQQHQGCTRRS